MAGSNGSPAQRGGPPPHWPAENEEQARALELERWRQEQAHAAQHGYAHPDAAQHGYQQPAPGYGQHAPYDPGHFGHPSQQGGYAQPHNQEPVRDPFEPPFGQPAQQYNAQHAPHFDRFAPVPPAQDHPAAYDPHHLAGGGREQVQDPFNPHRAPQHFDSHQGFDPHQPFTTPGGHFPDQHHGHLDARADPQSWDLSNYHPSQIPQGYQDHAGIHDPQSPPEWGSPTSGAHDAHWPQLQGGQGHWGPEAEHPHGQHYDPSAPASHQHYQLDPSYEHGHQQHGDDLAGDDYDDAPEEPRRRPSVLLVTGMLVGAIVVGGGLAFAYRQIGGTGHSANVAEIKRQTAPEKVRPDDPGGRKIEHSSNAFLNRSNGGAEARQSDVDGSAKKVATIPIVVNRDGSLTPQSSNDSVTTSSDSHGVPGLVLDGLGPPPGPPQLRPGTGPTPTESQASRMPPPPPPVERAPRVADLPLPKVVNAAPPPPQVTAAVEEPVPPPMRKPAVPQREERVAHRATAATSGLGAGGLDTVPRKAEPSISRNGYVAVLASKKSRQEALNTFADLHSQYPEVLGGVTPDVREANLGDKGVWYRLIGGPPGSREAARTICAKLKTRGMKDCWPVAY